MKEKRYQVFVSSTYDDLKEERNSVFGTITRLNYIPAGMEFFPAYDEDQLQFIKTIIDDSDYYVLIAAGRYGTVGPDGISFTEKEYLYAMDRGLPVLSFLHAKPNALPYEHSEQSDEGRAKLEKFRERIRDGRIVKFWNSKEELTLQVAESLAQTTKIKPGIGWVRGDVVGSVELLSELNDLRKKNDLLEQNIKNLESFAHLEDLADMEDEIILRFLTRSLNENQKIQQLSVSWKKLFVLIGPTFMAPRKEDNINGLLVSYVRQQFGWRGTWIDVLDEDIDTIKIQFIAMGFLCSRIVAEGSVQAEVLQLTPTGTRALISFKAVRATQADSH